MRSSRVYRRSGRRTYGRSAVSVGSSIRRSARAITRRTESRRNGESKRSQLVSSLISFVRRRSRRLNSDVAGVEWDRLEAQREMGTHLRIGAVPSALLRERFLVALPRGHRLASQDRVKLTDLADDDWLAASPDGIIVRACRIAGFEPRRVSITRDQLAIGALITAASPSRSPPNSSRTPASSRSCARSTARPPNATSTPCYRPAAATRSPRGLPGERGAMRGRRAHCSLAPLGPGVAPRRGSRARADACRIRVVDRLRVRRTPHGSLPVGSGRAGLRHGRADDVLQERGERPSSQFLGEAALPDGQCVRPDRQPTDEERKHIGMGDEEPPIRERDPLKRLPPGSRASRQRVIGAHDLAHPRVEHVDRQLVLAGDMAVERGRQQF